MSFVKRAACLSNVGFLQIKIGVGTEEVLRKSGFLLREWIFFLEWELLVVLKGERSRWSGGPKWGEGNED